MRYLHFLAGIIPGAGHAHRGSVGKGVVLFLLFAMLLNTSLMSPFWFPETYPYQIRIVSGVSTAFVWIYAYADLIRLHVARKQNGDNQQDETE